MKSSRHDNLAIGTVERETGISKDTLRKWETRYGFPTPSRSNGTERLYPRSQVERLRLIKQLLDTGMRPRQVVPLDATALMAMITSRPEMRAGNPRIADLMTKVASGNAMALRGALAHSLLHSGLEAFVLDTLKPLISEVGIAWAGGKLPVHAEHLFTETTQSLLRTAITALPAAADRPTLLLSTPPGELHGLGILMVQALGAIRGLRVISLGTQLPVDQIVLAAKAYGAVGVGLSFSTCYPARRIAPILQELTSQLPPEVEIWAGGDGVARAGKIPAAVHRFPNLGVAIKEIARLAALRPRIGVSKGFDEQAAAVDLPDALQQPSRGRRPASPGGFP